MLYVARGVRGRPAIILTKQKMPKNSLGRPDWKRKKQIQTGLWVVLTAVFCGTAVVVILYFMNARR